jgi:hypothetical protein
MAINNKDLKRFLDATKTEARLSGPLERHLQKRPAGDRDYTVLHPSEIIKRDHCYRASYYLLKGATRIADKPNLRLQSIFDEGHYIHAKWQKWFQEMGILHGNFKCVVCDKMTWGTSPTECEHCGASEAKLEYAEVTMRDDALMIKGHTDGWIKDDKGDFLIEIKSVGPGTIRVDAPELIMDANGDLGKAFNNIKRPFPSHILQGQMYLELMKRMGHEVAGIIFLYELKQDQNYKEFPMIKADYELVRHIFENAEDVVTAVKQNKVPECNNNPGASCKQCAPYEESQ